MNRKNSILFLAILTTSFSLILKSGFPILAIIAPYDDLLFVRLAGNLGSGLWLGPYDNLTLAKGAFYPLFILAAFVAGIPLSIAEQAVYLAACALAGRLIGRAAGAWAGLAVFVVLAFNPIIWVDDMSRVIREALYISLTLALVTLWIRVVITRPNPGSMFSRLIYAVVLGSVFAAFWLTREEGLWIVPTLATVVLVAIPQWIRGPRLMRGSALQMVAAGGVAVVLIAGVATMNLVTYGNFTTTEFKSPAFLHAYGALARIHHDSWKRYVIFPKDARERAYSAGPVARALRPAFEGEIGERWQKIGCDQTGTPDCTEILSGWFMWALRDAATAAGHAGSSRDAMAFYEQLGTEIDAACAAQTIMCDPPRATLMPAFRSQYVVDSLDAANTIAELLLTMGRNEISSKPSIGQKVALETFSNVVGPIRAADNRMLFVYGTITGVASVELHVRGDDTAIDTSVELVPEGPTGRRFSIATDCKQACELIVDVPGRPPTAIPWTQLVPGTLALGSTGQLTVAFSVAHFPRHSSVVRNAALVRIARLIAVTYSYAMPLVLCAGALGLAVALVMARRLSINVTLLAVTIASLVAVLSRIALLSYLDVTSIPSANLLYASPVSTFILLFSCGGVLLGGHTWFSWVSASRAGRRHPEG